MKNQWYKKSYRRNLVDMHIEDWDAKFLSKFEPEEYVELVSSANVQSAMVYANSHVGHCYWPTKSGHMHEGIKNRDILGELIDLFHRKGIDVIIYYSLIYVTWVYRTHPEWGVVLSNGEVGYGRGSKRYGVCCPNTAYRDFAVTQLQEICDSYEFEGVWPDMTFWPDVCYCSSCQERYQKETGRELPRILDWEDPDWVRFQRKREEWLSEFALLITNTIKERKPKVTVTHQAAAFLWNWTMGASLPLAQASEFMTADLYGSSLQQSYFLKLFNSISENLPVDFMTSRCPNLGYHTTVKTRSLLECQAFSAIANNASFLFIDAIDPLGTLNREIYTMMHEILRAVQEHEEYLGGRPIQDVAIYYSFESTIFLEDNGKRVEEVDSCSMASRTTKISYHLQSCLNVAKELLSSHIPYGVITRKNLNDISKFRVVILSNVTVMDHQEVDEFTEYVKNGGSLYVSKNTSLISNQGGKLSDFLLSGLLGVSLFGETKETITYMSPTNVEKELFHPYCDGNPLAIFGTQLKVKCTTETKILATLSLPYTDPADTDRFASIHSNPPGIETDYPAVVLREFGRGKVVYASGDIDTQYNGHVLINLLRHIYPGSFSIRTNAPRSVEVILYEQKERKRLMIHLINFQGELPNIPVVEIRVEIPTRGMQPKGLTVLPEKRSLDYTCEGEVVRFTAPCLHTYLLLSLEWQ